MPLPPRRSGVSPVARQALHLRSEVRLTPSRPLSQTPKSSDPFRMPIQTRTGKYRIDLISMTQENIATGNQRRVMRYVVKSKSAEDESQSDEVKEVKHLCEHEWLQFMQLSLANVCCRFVKEWHAAAERS